MGNRQLERTRRRWVDNINIYLGEIGCGVVEWIGLAQDRYKWRFLSNATMKLRVPENTEKLSNGYIIMGPRVALSSKKLVR
jgi:hypothetical protein